MVSPTIIPFSERQVRFSKVADTQLARLPRSIRRAIKRFSSGFFVDIRKAISGSRTGYDGVHRWILMHYVSRRASFTVLFEMLRKCVNVLALFVAPANHRLRVTSSWPSRCAKARPRCVAVKEMVEFDGELTLRQFTHEWPETGHSFREEPWDLQTWMVFLGLMPGLRARLASVFRPAD